MLGTKASSDVIVAETKPVEFDGNSFEKDMELTFSERSAGSLLKVGNDHERGITYWNHLDYDYWDCASIFAKSGNGGHGMKYFLKDKNTQWGGPDGGNGGRGGDVILECSVACSNL